MAVIQKMKEITVDTVLQGATDLGKYHFYQGDINGVKFLLNITHEGAEKDLSTATKVQIAFLKPDGTRVFQDCSNVNQTKGKYYVVLNTQSITAVGNVVAQIRITFPDSVIETTKFVFWVSESVMSDGVLQSTNDFPAIQQLIEAGKKFEGKDINAIIAAGAKADAALPKTGGTMTGNFNFQTKDGAKMLQWYNDQTQLGRVVFHPSGLVEWFGRNGATETSAWNYSPTTNTFNIVSNTNVVKTTGDTMTGTLNMTNSTVNWENVFLNNGGRRTRMFMDNGNGTAFTIATEKTAGKGDWDFNEHLRVGDRRNWLKNSGDTMTGHLNMNSNSQINYNQLTTTSSAKGFMYTDDASSNIVGGIGRFRNTTGESYYMGWGAQPWSGATSLQVSDAQFTYKNFAIKTAQKDGRVSLTLTTDAELFTANGVIADRRGNTVTLRAPFRKKSGGNTTPMFTMPSDMRPLLTVLKNIPSIDGVQGLLVINSNGEVWMQDLGSTSVTGKSFYVTVTYLVD